MSKKKNIEKKLNIGGLTFWPEVRITGLIDILGAVFSNQFFYLKGAL